MHCSHVVTSLLTHCNQCFLICNHMYIHLANSSGGILPDNIVCQGPLGLCCYTTAMQLEKDLLMDAVLKQYCIA